MAPLSGPSAPRRVGAIDIGTNTVLLLIAEESAKGPMAVLERASITRLGEGVDLRRRLSNEAMARTGVCLREYRSLLDFYGADIVQVVCTSAARDAENGGAFLAEAEVALGTRPRIIDGDEEARLTFEGALSGLDVTGPVTVFDVGGGSTEIIRGIAQSMGPTLMNAVSLDVGSVRLTERLIRHDPPHGDELDEIRRAVEQALTAATPEFDTTVIGVAGTVTTLSSVSQSLPSYDSARVHGSRLTRHEIARVLRELQSVPLASRRSMTGLEPARADVIVAGTVLVLTVLDWLRAKELVVSDRGVRWGLARRALSEA